MSMCSISPFYTIFYIETDFRQKGLRMYAITHPCTEARLERVLVSVSHGGASGTLGVRGVSAVC